MIPRMNEIPESSNSGTDLVALDYLREVKSSTCLLLPTTPSPTPLDFKHPLAEPLNEFLELNDDANIMTMQTLDTSAGDSSSSGDSNSVVQDPVSAQLINNISMLDYQTLSKAGDIITGQQEDIKLNGNLNMGSRKLPSFVNWNWKIIRTALLWVVISGLVACTSAIIAMIVMLPATCNPELPWYQGKVFYEVFPASFKDSNNDGIGDIRGLIKKLDYIQNLGVSAVRLNYIFEAKQYPEHYYNTVSVLKIDRSLGTLSDFKEFVTEVHNRNLSIILDIPVTSMATSKSVNITSYMALDSMALSTALDPTTAAVVFWTKAQKVDGLYLKGLENFVDDPNFAKSLQTWKTLICCGKILIANEEALKATGDALNVLLSRIDLIDIHLNLNDGTDGLKNRIEKVISGILWSKPHYPWVHWNFGDVNSQRISTTNLNNTLALITLEFALPGTVSIFYGDELGLGGVASHEVESDFHEHEHVHNLVIMPWSNSDKVLANILLWNSKSELEPQYHYLDVIKSLIDLRTNTPTIYLRSIFKEGNVLKNTEVRKSNGDLIIIERWYPRRNSCVFVGNLGTKAISTDLSTMFYGGTVVASTNTSQINEIIYFDHITFPPHSAMILKLEK